MRFIGPIILGVGISLIAPNTTLGFFGSLALAIGLYITFKRAE